MLAKLVSTIYTYLNAGGYYKTALEIMNAINVSQIQLYKKLRGDLSDYGPSRPKSLVNFQETKVSADALAELYFIQDNLGPNSPVIVPTNYTLNNRVYIVDLAESVEIQYVTGGDFYPVNVVPDNQFLMMKNNSVIYPKSTQQTKRPLGRMNGILRYEVYPSTFVSARARVLALPPDVNFRVIDNPASEVPVVDTSVNPGYQFRDTVFTEEKFNNLLFLTVASLGFNLSNGVLVQAGTQQEFKQL
jgi:hypothetical protein